MLKFNEIHIINNNLNLMPDNIEIDNIINVIRFKDIEFFDVIFELDKISYQNKIINYNRLDNANSNSHLDLFFENCTFKNKLTVKGRFFKTIRFDNCFFNNILLEGLYKDSSLKDKENSILFKNIKSLNNITVDNCEFDGKFYINKQYDENENEINKKIKINKLIIKDTEFRNNFKLHNCVIEEIKIIDSDFNKNADFYLSHFKSGIKNDHTPTEIIFKALNFRALALFGDTIFDKKFHLLYVTIEGYSHFRKAEFKEGLNLDYVNIQNEMNFFGVSKLDSNISRNNTSQETYRIIKHNFEKLGNKIEANKYHALELEKKEVYLSEKPFENLKDYIVFKLHKVSSEHSTNWFRTLLWIFFLGFLTVILVHFDTVKDLFFYPDNFKKEYLGKAWNEFLRFIYIGHMEGDLKSHPFVFLFNKVLLGYLYYQFLMSVRKDTRK